MKRTTVRMLLLLFLSVFSAYAFAQQKRTVTGTVQNEEGAPISGATFVIKGSRTGGATDAQGGFLISLSNEGTLVFSAIGYLSQEVSTIGKNEILVKLQKDDKSLDEVVVTGFGVKKQTRKLSYAITEVKGEELTRANNANVINALQGKVAGVMINQGASGPQSSSRIRIRGNTSFSSNNSNPLVVLDGILIEPGTTGNDSWGENPDFGNIMKNLNPDDYESVTVLKGAAASALYGSKAQSGVLLITTKKGSAKKGLGLSFSHTESFDKAYRLVDLQNQYGGGIYPTFETDAEGNRLIDVANAAYFSGGYSFGPKFDGGMVKEADGRMIKYEANNPLDYFRTGKFINSNVAVEGGNEKTTFRLSYSNLFNTSIMPNNDLKRNSFTLRATHKVSNAVSLDASVNYTNTKSKNPVRQGSRNNPLFAFTYYMPRHVDIGYYAENYINETAGGYLGSQNANLNDPYRLGSLFFGLYEDNRERTENNILANIDLNIKINSWLSALVRTNTNYYTDFYERKQLGSGVGFAGGAYEISQNNWQTFRIQGLLNAQKELSDNFSTSLSVGGETFRNIGGMYNNSYTSGGLKIPGLFAINNSINPAQTAANPAAGRRTDAIYAYGDVSWRDQLILNFSARNDWSSTLTYRDGSGSNSYFYPSVGLSWVFSEMEAVKNFSALSFGKLRGAISWSGLDTDPQLTNRTGFYGLVGTFNNAGNGNQSVYGFDGNTLGNLTLKNQLTRELEFGADVRFFNNRLGLDIAWYKKNTYNQIFPLSAPSESGISSRIVNGGNVQNQGIEVLLTATPIRTKNLTWNSTITFTRNRNKIISIAEGVNSIDLELAFGADVVAKAVAGGDYGTVETGFAFATYQKRDANGQPVAHPSNGQRVIGTPSFGSTGGYYSFMRQQDYDGTRKVLGSIMEKYLASTVQTLNYKNFVLNVQLDAKIGGLMASATHQYGSANGSLKNSLFGRDQESGGVSYVDGNGVTRNDGIIPQGVLADGLTATNASGDLVDLGGMTYDEAIKQGLLKPIPAYAYYENLSQWASGIREYSVFENSWVAVREVSIGYNLPKSLVNKVKMNSLRVGITGRNLGYLYTTTKDGINPESIYSNRAAAFAEYGGYPWVRSLGFNVNATF
ncbi:SusC/RagA family TonB-linked outer membrane protein [Flavihumibacter sp. UBA7668]|uniref:SusC/RagA family TonB-linked outer membrane protein n=1 Tax=Flavihumibacter sp. UBA7668 TaxID=1946542 RepID=UPI0025C09D88|nr:SusC/RagA family TonB-linked outer membrane protein [Flavihumibacter sp. UBA7668]